MRIAALVLAAGYSSRLGDFKPLMEIGGHQMVDHCIRLFRRCGIAEILVITGYRHEEVESAVAGLGVDCIVNADYDSGMYSSVCSGVRGLAAGADGFFVLPVDIPLVRPATVDLLCDAFRGEAVVYPTFDGRRGHPPLIPSAVIPAILAHDGRGGLQFLLSQYDSHDIPVWDQGILLDADTPEDFAMLVRRMERLTVGSQEEALALASLAMAKRGVDHGLAVAGIARALGEELNLCGQVLDIELLFNSGLLHDIGKGHPQHEEYGARQLKDLGLDRLSEIVGAHRDAQLPVTGLLSEKEVVCLADKLVRGATILTVKKRFAEKLELYADDTQVCRAIKRRLANALALQAKVERITGKSVGKILANHGLLPEIMIPLPSR